MINPMTENLAENRIRIGVLGAGRNATGHVKALGQKPAAEIIAIADTVPELAQTLADSCGARACAHLGDFLDEVDAVVISTPSFLHPDQFQEAAEAGKAVLLEKPMATNPGDAVRVAEIASKTGVKTMIGFSVRFSGFVRECLRGLEDGRLGALKSLTTRRHCQLHPDQVGGWLLDPKRSGGMMLEMNIHEIDWLMAVGGLVKTVDARCAPEDPRYPRMSDFCSALMEFENGAMGLHDGGWKSPQPNFLKAVIGEKGGFGCNEWGDETYYAPNGQNRESVAAEPLDKHEHFLDVVAGRVQSECDVAWSLEVHAVVESILASAERREPVDVKTFKEEMKNV
ncbi:MAG: Gfo/Idh/MocA family protein [Opitutales bacterium]